MASRIIKKAVSILSVADYKKKIEACYEKMKVAQNYYSLVFDLNYVYRTMKNAVATIGLKNDSFLYESLRDRIYDCEELCESTFIVESDPDFDLNDYRFANKSILDIKKEELLDYIAWFTRVRLYESHVDEAPGETIEFNKLHLTNDCRLGSNIIKLLCDSLKIPCEVIKIPPAFTDEFMLYRGNGFHYFCLVTIDDVKYIFDTTYRQFFTLNSNNLNRLGVMGLTGCNPGVYMLMNDSRKNTALNILKKGYVVASNDNLKNYFDGFCLSYRNGLFYEWIGEVDYTTPYTVEEYFNFLSGEELLFDYEPIEFLGEQQEPLKKCNFRFKI